MPVETKIMRVEIFDDRAYRIEIPEGRFDIASVTTKLGIENKPFLYRYYAELGWDEARKKLQQSQERGVRVHYAWFIYVTGGAVIYNPWQNPIYSEDQIEEFKKAHDGRVSILTDQWEMVAVWKLQRFFEAVKPQILQAETTVYDIKRGIAGTLDNSFLIEKGTYPVNGARGLEIKETGIYLADLKTGNQVSESAWAQLAAYTEAYESMGLGQVKGALVLHTSAQTKKSIEGFSTELKTRDELRPHFEIFKHLAAVWDARNPGFAPMAFEFPSLIVRKKE